MPISILPFAMALSSAYAAITFGSMQPSAEPAQGALPQAREWHYATDAGSISRSLNDWAASGGVLQTPLGSARLQQLTAEISDNRMIVRGTASLDWFNLPVDAAATASVHAENVQVHVVNAHVNGMDVPDAARSQLEQQLQNEVVQAVAGAGVAVRSVRLGDGKLEVTWIEP